MDDDPRMWNARRLLNRYDLLCLRGLEVLAHYDAAPSPENRTVLVQHVKDLDQAWLAYCSASLEWTQQGEV